MEFKFFSAPAGASLVQDIGEGVLRGLASPYNLVDQGNDKVLPGAFTNSLKAKGNIRPFLAGHDQKEVIGLCRLTDSPRGLLCEAELALELQCARDTQIRLRNGLIKGLSIGYKTVRSRKVGGVRELQEVDIFEVSAVGFPMAPEALITEVKGFSTADMLDELRDLQSGMRSMLTAIRKLREGVESDASDAELKSFNHFLRGSNFFLG